jgi:hypothetical protein
MAVTVQIRSWVARACLGAGDLLLRWGQGLAGPEPARDDASDPLAALRQQFPGAPDHWLRIIAERAPGLVAVHRKAPAAAPRSPLPLAPPAASTRTAAPSSKSRPEIARQDHRRKSVVRWIGGSAEPKSARPAPVHLLTGQGPRRHARPVVLPDAADSPSHRTESAFAEKAEPRSTAFTAPSSRDPAPSRAPAASTPPEARVSPPPSKIANETADRQHENPLPPPREAGWPRLKERPAPENPARFATEPRPNPRHQSAAPAAEFARWPERRQPTGTTERNATFDPWPELPPTRLGSEATDGAMRAYQRSLRLEQLKRDQTGRLWNA